jgi:hypothetical protein
MMLGDLLIKLDLHLRMTKILMKSLHMAQIHFLVIPMIIGKWKSRMGNLKHPYSR